MRLRWCVLLLTLAASVASAQVKSHHHPRAATKLPVTTSSPVARLHFEKAMKDLEQVRMPDLADELRAATKADANFAQAWILLANFTHNPDEQQIARAHAQETAAHATRGEQLLVKWFANAEEDNFVPAIAAMNDVLAMYPRDYPLATLAGGWLFNQQRYEHSITVLKRALSEAPDYANANNEIGYAYAYTGDYAKAIQAMDRYVALMPNEPNPHDSYGEILRMAGKFDAALEEYRKSIQIDPTFGSELGVADTYTMMGKQDEARDEYSKAIMFARSESDKVQYEFNAAVTWIRENNHKQAERALRAVAKHAHNAGLARWEAEAHRVLALNEPEYNASLKELDAAERVFAEPRQISRVDRDEEHARILLARALRAADANLGQDAANAASELQSMAQTSRSEVIQLAYHAAEGAVLLETAKYAEAIEQLQEDSADPLALRLLWRAYTAAGKSTEADATANKLATTHIPTAEQALVVPQFRASMVSQADGPAH